MNQTQIYSRDLAAAREAAFLRRVYNWMLTGLALTGCVAWLTAGTEFMVSLIYGSPLVFYGLLIGEVLMVFILAARVNRMSASTATLLFVVYSILNGLTLSFIFLLHAQTNVGGAFLVTAGTFGAMSLYGYTTKRSLASWGSFLFMGLMGIIIASVVNLFLASSTVSWLVTYAGVLVFTGLTAYDTQRLRVLAAEGFAGAETETKAAVVGALALYLDFVNLFLMILRIFSGRD
ncbi:MAG: Bax inhibitor-1/YccA family protein [Thermodesulfobacteriota bacterium]